MLILLLSLLFLFYFVFLLQYLYYFLFGCSSIGVAPADLIKPLFFSVLCYYSYCFLYLSSTLIITPFLRLADSSSAPALCGVTILSSCRLVTLTKSVSSSFLQLPESDLYNLSNPSSVLYTDAVLRHDLFNL